MTGNSGLTDPLRRFLALERDVLVLSIAMFCFSLAFQMTSRYLPRYMSALGAGALAIGLFGAFTNVVGALYPYPGGSFSDRVGSRKALTLFGFLSSLGFAVWLTIPVIGDLRFMGYMLPSWSWVFVGLLLAQAWKSLGLGATFAVVKQAVSRERLATGFASTETFRRTAFLVGPLVAAAVLAAVPEFVVGFQYVLGVGLVFAVFATMAQHHLYEPRDREIGRQFGGVKKVVKDLRSLPDEVRSLLAADVFVRFANGLVYVFFVIVVTELRRVDVTLAGTYLSPDAYFGVLLAIEMLVALLVMVPAARVADAYGLKPVVVTGFAVYALFPLILITIPPNPLLFALVFAFSGVRFAGLPAHKALIVGPAEEKEGGRVTGSYYLLRNGVVMPSPLVGGALYAVSPLLAFGAASLVGVVGTAYFLAYGSGFRA